MEGLPAEGKLVLPNFTEYAKLVADAYQARPVFEQEYAKSWKVLMESLKTMYKRLQSKFEFEFTDKDPYSSMEQMRRDVEETGVLKVYTGHSEHPVWTPEENHIFRAVHDAMGHLAGYQKGKGHRFDLRGELGVYNRQLKVVPHAARDALFTELVGQVCTSIVTGGFPKQKVTRLWGFDYVNVGKLDDKEYEKNFEGSFKEKVAAKYAVADEIDAAPAAKKKDPKVSYKLEDDEDDGGKKIVAKVASKVIGSISFDIVNTSDSEYRFDPYQGEKFLKKVLEWEDIAEIKNLEVEPEYRQNGVATSLMQQAMHYIGEHWSGMPVMINASPFGARGSIPLQTLVDFYAKFGFKVLKTYPEHRNAFMWKKAA